MGKILIILTLILGLIFLPPSVYGKQMSLFSNINKNLSFIVYPNIDSQEKDLSLAFENALKNQNLGSVYLNPLKYAIRASIKAGVTPNTIILLLLLPLIATLISLGRHLVGFRGFGIFLPAAMSFSFVSLGPLLGIGLFLLIVLLSTGTRIILKKLKVRLQYLPRMALILWLVSVGILVTLFLTPAINGVGFSNISIFPVLILTLLAEDFIKVQLGKSVRVAVLLTVETLILALACYFVLASETIQVWTILHPELVLLSTLIADILAGKYVGLRIFELFRFRKLISS